MHRVTTTFLLVMVASLLLGDQAEGHLVAQAREMLITVGPEDVEVRARLFLHEGPEAARLRAAADLDGDGLVSNGAEQDGLSLRLKALATSELSLTLNETALPLALDYQRLALDGGPGVEPGGGIHFEVVTVSRGVLGPGSHRLRIEDAPAGGRGVVALQLRLGAGVSLTAHHPSGASTALSSPASGVRHGGFGSGGGALTLDLLCLAGEARRPAAD